MKLTSLDSCLLDLRESLAPQGVVVQELEFEDGPSNPRLVQLQLGKINATGRRETKGLK